jgi:ankyrin repeat protein
MRRRTRKVLRYCGLAAAGFVAVMLAFPLLHVRVSTERRLVAHPKPIQLLFRGASDDAVKQSVLATGKHPDEIQLRGGSLLFYTATFDRPELVRWLLEQGADPDGTHPAGVPLVEAISEQNAVVAAILLEHGADPDRRTGIGHTPRELAQEMGNAQLRLVFERVSDSQPAAGRATSGPVPGP